MIKRFKRLFRLREPYLVDEQVIDQEMLNLRREELREEREQFKVDE